jgi:hypothetical protein
MALRQANGYSENRAQQTQEDSMAEDYPPTVRIRRPVKVTTDERGRTVWAETVETVQLELVSTAMLQKILAWSDDDIRTAIERIVSGEEEGVLARDPATGLFEIISDADLQAILRDNDNLPKTERLPDMTLEPVSSTRADTSNEMSLVSTQVLRKILHKDSPTPAPQKKDKGKKDEGSGFDPYDSG